jgi:ubiquinone/menaquinone biosynthesis C-methylase UbiE/DNA-binding transcriptional ArsR family regulator
MDLAGCTGFLRALSDPTRLRLLALLEQEELTVAELAAVTRLAQPRVSTHLSKLKELDLVRDRRAGVSAYYRFNAEGADSDPQKLWRALRDASDDALLRDDAKRMASVLAKRSARGWADTVAGDMERHYSPGRTWEALARGFMNLLEVGDVLDIASGDGVVAELVAPHAKSVTCVDASPRVVEAARKRLSEFENVDVRLGDMHALDLPDGRFELVLMMHALPYSEKPAAAIAEAARVLKRGGRLLICTLAKHAHKSAVESFDHRNLGFTANELKQLVSKTGLDVVECRLATREKRPPHFEVLALVARRK